MNDKEYKEWKKTRKQFITHFNDITIRDGKIVMFIRNDDKTLKVGDSFGGATLLKIEAYGHELQELGEGMTAALTFDDMPIFYVQEDSPDYVKWRQEVKSNQKNQDGNQKE
jgi:hypothetical protein